MFTCTYASLLCEVWIFAQVFHNIEKVIYNVTPDLDFYSIKKKILRATLFYLLSIHFKQYTFLQFILQTFHLNAIIEMQKKITFNGTGICNFQLITHGSDIPNNLHKIPLTEIQMRCLYKTIDK